MDDFTYRELSMDELDELHKKYADLRFSETEKQNSKSRRLTATLSVIGALMMLAGLGIVISEGLNFESIVGLLLGGALFYFDYRHEIKLKSINREIKAIEAEIKYRNFSA